VRLELQQRGIVKPDDEAIQQRISADIISSVDGDHLDVERINRSVMERWEKSANLG
jgi:hypothetical protein